MTAEIRSERPARQEYTGRASVVLEDVTVRFPRRRQASLRVESLRLAPGEQALVVGPSGGGKSTLLQTLSGVVPLSVSSFVTGRVEICGTRTSASRIVDLARHVGVVAQDPGAGVCLPRVEQELAMVLENHAVAPDDITARIGQALARVEAAHLRERSTDELSGGEAQRVALAAALVANPDVLLVDEPTSMLDAEGTRAVRRALAGLTDHAHPTVVMVEHRLDEFAGPGGLDALPGRLIVLDGQGRVVAVGPTCEIFQSQARSLSAAGCWLPLEVELYAWTGAEDGLSAAENRQLLHRLAREHAAGTDKANRAPATEPVLSARGMFVTRGDTAVPVLTDVDLDLFPGEVVALLGPNGVGKSTLLLALAGLLRPQAGRLEGPRPGVVFQNAEHQFVAHTVADEIRYGLVPGSEDVVARQLHRHRLRHLADHSPYRLSGGEKRRLSLAAMLAHNRPALLLDEPTLGLDRRDTTATTSTLRELAAQGTAVLFTSHDIRTVATLADRVILLDEGDVLADGPTMKVLADDELVHRARLELPPLVRYLLRNVGPAQVRTVLRALDDTVCGGTR